LFLGDRVNYPRTPEELDKLIKKKKLDIRISVCYESDRHDPWTLTWDSLEDMGQDCFDGPTLKSILREATDTI
jgi:hypothetical protein